MQCTSPEDGGNPRGLFSQGRHHCAGKQVLTASRTAESIQFPSVRQIKDNLGIVPCDDQNLNFKVMKVTLTWTTAEIQTGPSFIPKHIIRSWTNAKYLRVFTFFSARYI